LNKNKLERLTPASIFSQVQYFEVRNKHKKLCLGCRRYQAVKRLAMHDKRSSLSVLKVSEEEVKGKEISLIFHLSFF
jgi:hypothetical protein